MAIFTMPMFCLLVLLAAFVLWLLAARLYKPVGTFVHQLFKNASDNMSDDNSKDKKEIRL